VDGGVDGGVDEFYCLNLIFIVEKVGHFEKFGNFGFSLGSASFYG
jgi:hypothetical protein